MNLVEALLALELGLNHSPYCRRRNQTENNRRPAIMRRYICYCDFEEELRKGMTELIRRGLFDDDVGEED